MSKIQSLSGGRVSMAALSTIAGGYVTGKADGMASVLSLPALTTWYGTSASSLTASSGGTVELNPVQTNVTTLPVVLSTISTSIGTIEVGTLSLNSASSLSGIGTVVGNVIVSGQMYPGGSAALGGLAIDGDCTFSSTGKLNMDIGGVAPLIQYDQLTVAGTTTFGGTLALYWRNSFVPAQSDKFDLVFWGARSGEFASVTGTVPAAGHTMRVVYRPNRLVIGELAGLISPAVPVISTPRNVATSYDLTPHNEFAAQPSWSISPSETSLYTASIDANSILTITPKSNEHGTAAPILTLTDLSDGFSDVQDLDLTVELILPTPPIPFIFPSGEPLETDNLVCGLYPGTVGPGCPIQYEYTWTNAAAPSHTGTPPFVPQTVVNGPKSDVVDILDASYTSPHEIWTCTVRTYDGQYYSSTPGVALSGAIKALAHSTLTLNSSAPSVTLGDFVTLSGNVSPVVGVASILFEETVTPTGGTDTKPPTTNTNSSSTFSFQFLPDEAGSWGFQAEWDGNRTHFGDSAVAALTVNKAQPTVTLEVTPSSMPLGEEDEVAATARLTSSLPPQLGALLAGRRVRLFLRMPDGSSAGPVEADTDNAGIASFDHADFAAAGISFNQPGTWQFIAEFPGDANLLRATSPGYDTPGAERLTVKDGAGYAIIAVGQLDATAEGLEEHQLTADNVYRALRDRGFADEDIYYLRRGPQQPAADIFVDDISPSKADLQAAIQGWAPAQMNNAAAPLVVVLLDHGAPDQFFMFDGVATNNEHVVTPGELDGYLTTLEGALNTAARTKPLTLVYGACHSGSFIPALSGPNRIVVTSTSAEEKSHRGPALTEGGVRGGELFV
ncbi:MAG: hypothetical protein WC655_29870, partial [Candidatus Hydrogenedentales bacterium]